MSAIRYIVPIFPLLMLVMALLRFLTGRQSEETMQVFWIMVAVCFVALLMSLWWAFGPRFLAGIFRGTRCPNCYAKLKNDTGFCPKCGAVVEGPKDAYMSRCAKCGGDVDPDREFCPHCGTMLKIE